MTKNFASVHNYHEDAVYQRVTELAPLFATLADAPDLLADVACVALNALPPRYIRHAVDMMFYMTEAERAKISETVETAVHAAFVFVQSRSASEARA